MPWLICTRHWVVAGIDQEKQNVGMAMKNEEFYVKNKIKYRPLINPVFDKRNRWQTVLITLAVALVEPLLMYKRLKVATFSLEYYLQLFEYCLLIIVPFVLFLFWLNRREELKLKRGYDWVGKFEVIRKQVALVFCYLHVRPGNSKLRVERTLFDSVRTGDYIMIRRDALGGVEEIKKVNNFPSRLTRSSNRELKHNTSE